MASGRGGGIFHALGHILRGLAKIAKVAKVHKAKAVKGQGKGSKGKEGGGSGEPMTVTECPWCATNIPPVVNETVRGEEQLANPLLCPRCQGVGTFEEWGFDVNKDWQEAARKQAYSNAPK